MSMKGQTYDDASPQPDGGATTELVNAKGDEGSNEEDGKVLGGID
jgi:hypothetical protein